MFKVDQNAKASSARTLTVAQEVTGVIVEEKDLLLVGRKGKEVCYVVIVPRRVQGKAALGKWLAWQSVNSHLLDTDQEWAREAWRKLAEIEMESRPDEWALVPIAFWSRALSGAQLG